MYAVSLLPSEYKNYQSAIKRNDKLIFIGLIAVIIVTAVLITSIAITKIYTNQLKNIKSENDKIQLRIDELKPIEEMQRQAADMYLQINQTAGLSPQWSELITDIGNSTSPEIDFISFDAQYKDQGGTLVIMGNARSHDDVSTLIEALSGVGGISNIQCKISSEVSPEQTKEVQFELDIQISTGTPYNLPLGGVQ